MTYDHNVVLPYACPLGNEYDSASTFQCSVGGLGIFVIFLINVVIYAAIDVITINRKPNFLFKHQKIGGITTK